MPKYASLTLLLAALVLAGCAPPGRYPMSVQECGPDDPVRGMSQLDCVPA